MNEKKISDPNETFDFDEVPLNNDNQSNPMEFHEQELSTPEQISQDRIRYLLKNIRPGYQIAVIRIKPSWARGHLETYEYYGDDDEPIDIDYLIRMWGGHRLQIRILGEKGRYVGGGSIPLYSYPPKVRGKIITEQDSIGSTTGPDASMSRSIPHYIPQPQNTLDIGKILDLLSKNKGNDIGSTLKLLEYIQASKYNPTPPQGNPMEQMLQMAQMFRQMKDIFGEFSGGGGGGDDSDGFMPLAGDLLKTLLTKQNQPQPVRGVLSPPSSQAPKRESAPTPHANTEKDSVLSLAKKISELDSSDAAGVAFLALDSMPTDKRESVIRSIISEMSNIDETEENEDNIDRYDGNS